MQLSIIIWTMGIKRTFWTFDIDIEQIKPLVRTFYAETRCTLLISQISTQKTLDKRVTYNVFYLNSLKKKPLFT